MKTFELDKAFSILANVGVIVGIVFLVIELRQNNELIAQDARLNRASMVKETWRTLVDHPGLVGLLIKDRNNEPLTEREELLLNAFWMDTFLAVQWQYQEQLGETMLPAMRRNATSYGSLRRTWQGGGISRGAGKDGFDPDFVLYLEEHIPVLSESTR